MKGFKPTGYGPSTGFKFPSSMGFTGSTGAYTSVQPYVRRKGFANGGFVRQDNPRMKSDVVGDQGSALVRRARSSTAEDQESGGKSPLRPGYKKGGRAIKRAFGGGVMSRAMRDAVARAQQQQLSAPTQPASMQLDMSGGLKGALSQLAMRARQQASPSPQVRTPEAGRKLRGRVYTYAEGGVVAKGHGPIAPRRKKMPQPRVGAIKGKFLADGGRVKDEYAKPSYMEAVKDRVKEMVTTQAKSSTGLAKRAADKIEARRSRIDSAVDEAVSGKNYACGGKVHRMGKAGGGAISDVELKRMIVRKSPKLDSAAMRESWAKRIRVPGSGALTDAELEYLRRKSK